MANPTLQRNWTSSQNQTPSDQTTQEKQGASILLALKNAFVSAGWTVTQSSDSVTANSSDNWSTITDVVHASSGAHSWIVLRSPLGYPSTGNYYYFAIDWLSSQPYQCDFYTATSDWTGGTTSSIGTGTNTVFWSNMVFLNSSLTDMKFHQTYSDEGDLVFIISQNSNGNPGFGLFINKLSNTSASDDYPVVTYIFGNQNAFSQSSFRTSYGWNRRSNLSSTNYTKMHWINGTVGYGVLDVFADQAVANMAGRDTNGSDIDGTFPALPIICTNQNTSQYAFRGVLTDLFQSNGINGIYTPKGSVLPSAGTITAWSDEFMWYPGDTNPDYGP
jgi:hypothetical protein